ncbi:MULTISPECIES: hypothetical protein [Sphingobacterium]|uniref:Uncharacterized protein n=1 Tax=Sphingobacterium tenebrionis TaxID=3111775 RepID=A0ABU8I9N6_9SPHI|nr:hypothetical protein [Sphingobacterium sp. 1.A.4]
MNPILRNILAIIVGFVIGSAVNMFFISISASVIPVPEGVDNTTTEGLKAGLHLFQPKHFLFPFLAHGLGTLVGAFFAALIAASRKLLFAMVIGFLFFLGGLVTILMLPSPIWFTIVDLLFAYFPMAWIGYLLSQKKNQKVINKF